MKKTDTFGIMPYFTYKWSLISCKDALFKIAQGIETLFKRMNKSNDNE